MRREFWWRGAVRSTSALVMLTYVICHLGNHIVLLISIPFADAAHHFLIDPWKTLAGTTLLLTAALSHYANALWSIYIRRSLTLPRWGWWQLGLGLSIPLILLIHLAGTRISEDQLGVSPDYTSVLLRLWVLVPWKGMLQVVLLSIVWIHASIGIHYWLRNKRWYARWRTAFAVFALLWPVLALAGFVAGGNEVFRAAQQGGYLASEMRRAHISAQADRTANGIAFSLIGIHLGLVGLAFGGRAVRRSVERGMRPVVLTHSSGRTIPIVPGAAVLESLNDARIPHAQVCGGRARCTTCRVRVVEGLETLPVPSPLEGSALSRISAPRDVRLACQLRPTADLSIVPLLAPSAAPADGFRTVRFAGVERSITVMFVDLRGSTRLGEARLPYDMLFLLDQFFIEMNAALASAGGHFSQFTGDGLMALFGIDEVDESAAARAALQAAYDMKERLHRINRRLMPDLDEPLRVGIGIHGGDAIVGTLGPPGSQILTAIGDTVNIAARIEGLSKTHDDAVIVSRRTAEFARVPFSPDDLHVATVAGRVEPIEYLALPKKG